PAAASPAYSGCPSPSRRPFPSVPSSRVPSSGGRDPPASPREWQARPSSFERERPPPTPEGPEQRQTPGSQHFSTPQHLLHTAPLGTLNVILQRGGCHG